MRRVKAILSGLRNSLVLASCLLLSGCFGFNFWFERLDSVALWQLDRMLDLDDQQQEILRPEIIQYREWLRRETLPQMTKSLQRIKTLWDSQQYQLALVVFEEETEDALHATLEASWPRVAPLLVYLTPENVQAYWSYVESRSDDWYKETVSDKAKQDERIDHLENWFGNLSRNQIDLVRIYTRLHEDERAVRIENGYQRRQKFMTLALNKDWETLEKLVTSPVLLQTSAYQTWRQLERQQLHALLRALIPTLSQQQKHHVSETLAEWIDRFTSVSGTNPDNST